MVLRISRFCRKSFLVFSLMFSASSLATLYADGLPGEYLATQRWRFLFSSQSPVSNPALINEANYLSLRYALSSTMGNFTMQEIGLVYPIGLYQTVALTALLQGVNAYDATDNKLDLTGTKINDQQYFLMGSYAWNVWSRLTVGANVNIISYPFANNSIGIGLDLGLTYSLLNNPVIGTHLLGASLQNAMMVLVNSKEKYPRNLRLSLNSTYWERQIESGFDLAIKDIATSKSEYLQDSDAEPEWDLNAKLGIWILRFANLYGIASLEDDGLKSLGFALGFNIPSVNNGRDVSILYQYLTSPDNLNGTHTFYVKGDIGKHREEVYARRMARMANISPNSLYMKAVELYSQGNYWDAFFLFNQVFVEFPDFFKNDWVSYFMASCKEYLDMRTTSEESYQQTKNQFSRSAVIPYVDLGMMRVYYRDGDFDGINRQFNALNKLGVPDSVKFHGYYIMGETEMKQGNNSKAKQLFDMIPENHPDYIFAQHSEAIITAAADNIEGAVVHLENCIQYQANTNAQKEIVNRSYVFLGYIFYEELTKEEGSLAKAVTALRMVPKTSYYYTDALLGLGWTSLKARQWTDCMNLSQELTATAKNTIIKAEGTLLQAYSYMIQKNFGAAVNLLSNASSELQNYQVDQKSEFADQKLINDDIRLQYDELAKSTSDLVNARQSSLVIKQIDSLHVLQKRYIDQLNSFASYSDNYNRNSFFNRSYEDIKGDVDYALAKAQKSSGASKTDKETGKINKETSKIDDELERLKKELEAEQNKIE